MTAERVVTIADLAMTQLLSVLPEEALTVLARCATAHFWDAGDVLFERGDAGDTLHVVLEGTIRIVPDRLDDQIVLELCETGAVFGELAVFDPAPRAATAIAATVAITAEIDRNDLEAAINHDPTVALRMLGSMARYLTAEREQLQSVGRFLDRRIRDRTAEAHESQMELLHRLEMAANARDGDTGSHLARMSSYAAELALAAGMDRVRAEQVRAAAPMHDVGKIGVPDAILLKPGDLTDDEWEVMKSHTVIGAQMLQGSHSPVMKLAARIALTHHERWDGRGYPSQLQADQIPIEARISSIADVFDALTSERPYKHAWTFADALTAIEEQAGGAFDPDLTALFVGLEHRLPAIRDEATARVRGVPVGEPVLSELER